MKKRLTTRQAAKELGVTRETLQVHLAKGTFPGPRLVELEGGGVARLWTAEDIRATKKALAKIKTGRPPKNHDDNSDQT